ncbi:MAG: GNAT family N-acetyltransferase [Akkermansiaceae bacterium]
MTPVRRLRLGEGNLYRQVRLESLKESPEAFGSTYENALARDIDSWSTQADSSADGSDRATYIIEDTNPLGLAAIYRDDSTSSEGELIQMWVAPELRGKDAAKALLDELFLWAATNNLSIVRAEVYRNNIKALRFYENYGFTISSHDSETTVTLAKPVEPIQCNQ